LPCLAVGCSDQGKAHGFGSLIDHPELTIKTLKQEAGEIESTDGSPLDMSAYPIGMLLGLQPWHSCASTKSHQKVHVVKDGMVTAHWDIAAGW